jgi:MFS transporter, ACS family, tartrate transporter
MTCERFYNFYSGLLAIGSGRRWMVSPLKDELERRALAKVKWRFFAYFLLGQFLVQLDKTNIGFAQITMGKDLGLSSEAFGLAAGAFALAAVFMQFPAARLFEFFGARRWLTATTLLWGSTCMAEGFVTTSAQLVALRFLLGIFEAGFFPGLIILVSRWFKGKQHGQAIGILLVGSATAGMVGGPFAGWILGTSLFAVAGWRNLFILEGATTLVFGAAALSVLCDDVASARWLKSDERGFLEIYLGDAGRDAEHSGACRPSLLGALKDGRIRLLVVSSASAGWIYGTFTFFSPTLLKMAGHGFSTQAVGLLSAGLYMTQAIVSFAWGMHSDRHADRRWHLIGALAVGAAGVIFYPVLSKHALLAMLCLAMVQSANGAFLVTFWPTVNLVVDKAAIPKATALIQTGSQLGGFLAPVVFGWLMDVSHGNTSLGLYEAAAVFLLNLAIMNVLFRRYGIGPKNAPIRAGRA